MALDKQEQLQIAEIVSRILDARLEVMTKDIVKGFVGIIDWHNENFAKIIESQNKETINALYKRERERIEIQTAQARVEHEKIMAEDPQRWIL